MARCRPNTAICKTSLTRRSSLNPLARDRHRHRIIGAFALDHQRHRNPRAFALAVVDAVIGFALGSRQAAERLRPNAFGIFASLRREQPRQP